MNIKFSYELTPLLLSMTLFVCHSVSPEKVGEGILCPPTCAILLFICLPLLVWPFIFTEKPDCNKIIHVLSVISIIRILIELFQMIWGCICTSFVVCQPFYWSLSLSVTSVVLCHQCLILVGPGALVLKES